MAYIKWKKIYNFFFRSQESNRCPLSSIATITETYYDNIVTCFTHISLVHIRFFYIYTAKCDFYMHIFVYYVHTLKLFVNTKQQIYNVKQSEVDNHSFVCIYVKVSLNFVLTIKMYQTTLMPSSLFEYIFIFVYVWQFSPFYICKWYMLAAPHTRPLPRVSPIWMHIFIYRIQFTQHFYLNKLYFMSLFRTYNFNLLKCAWILYAMFSFSRYTHIYIHTHVRTRMMIVWSTHYEFISKLNQFIFFCLIYGHIMPTASRRSISGLVYILYIMLIVIMQTLDGSTYVYR